MSAPDTRPKAGDFEVGATIYVARVDESGQVVVDTGLVRSHSIVNVKVFWPSPIAIDPRHGDLIPCERYRRVDWHRTPREAVEALRDRLEREVDDAMRRHGVADDWLRENEAEGGAS